MKKIKFLSVFLVLVSFISILNPQQIFAAKTKYVLVSESGDREEFSIKECFSRKDTDINFFRETAGPGAPYNFKYTYNKKGQLTKAVVRKGIGMKYFNEHILTYKYDKKGRLVKKNESESWPKYKKKLKWVYTYTYNKKNQLILIKQYRIDGGKFLDYTYKYSYYSNGNIKSCTIKYRSAETDKWTFYSNGNIKSYDYIDLDDGKPLESAKYDSNGNIVEDVIFWRDPRTDITTYNNIYNNDILEKTVVTDSQTENKTREIIYHTDGVLKGEIKEEQEYYNGVQTHFIFYEYKLDSSGKRIVQKQKCSLDSNGEKNIEWTQNYKWKKISIK